MQLNYWTETEIKPPCDTFKYNNTKLFVSVDKEYIWSDYVNHVPVVGGCCHSEAEEHKAAVCPADEDHERAEELNSELNSDHDWTDILACGCKTKTFGTFSYLKCIQ